MAWQVRPGVEQQRSCGVRQTQPRWFLFDPQTLRQVKQWQAFLHEQAEIFLARPDLRLWQKARRRSASMPFHVPRWTDNVLQFRRLFKSRCCLEKKKICGKNANINLVLLFARNLFNLCSPEALRVFFLSETKRAKQKTKQDGWLFYMTDSVYWCK